MNEIKFERILFIGLLLTVVGTTVFSFNFTRVQAAIIQATVKIAVCGNGIIEGEEQCEGTNLAGKTCLGLGFGGGNLRCTSACTLDISGCTAPLQPPVGGGGPVYIPPLVETKVIIKGKAFPEAEITLLSGGQIIATKKADSSADFRFEITKITSGIYTFSLWALDNEGKKSATFSLTTNIAENVTTTISEIFLPPTVELKKIALKRGEFLDIFGQTAPESEVFIYIGLPNQELIKNTKAQTNGKWFYSFDPAVLDKGSYFIKVKAISPEGFVSSFSQALVFYLEIVPVEEICPRGDLNQDGKVNLVDFSILLYWWGKANACADQNRDGTVNLPDFSIMMYYWTG